MAAAAVQQAPLLPTRPLPDYEQAPESSFDLDWADLVTLDLSKFDQPNGKQELAKQLKDAVHNIGFFYITGFGYACHPCECHSGTVTHRLHQTKSAMASGGYTSLSGAGAIHECYSRIVNLAPH